MSLREYEFFNITPPLANTPAMRCIAVLPLGPTGVSQDLRQLFGEFSAGHYLSIKPEIYNPSPTGYALAYVAFSGSSGTLNPTLLMGGTGVGTGVGTGAAWALAHNEELRVAAPFSGREVGTGVASDINYSILRIMSNGPTGYLRLYRSSTRPNDLSPFPFPKPTDY